MEVDMTDKDPKDMTDEEWLAWLKTRKKAPTLTREESIKWMAAKGRLTNPTEKERAIDELMLLFEIEKDET